MFDPNFIGMNGFVWFIGVVEDRNDPLKCGRVRVRCWGHDNSNLAETPVDDLPWATVLGKTGSSGVGESVSWLTEGTWVFGFFIDGIEKQEQFILGAWQGLPMTPADRSKGFNDPRSSTSSYPRVVTSVTYKSDGTESVINDVDQPFYPRVLNEPEVNRLAREDGMNRLTEVLRDASRSSGQVNVQTASHSSAGGSDSSIPGGSFSEPPTTFNPVYPFNHVLETESGHVVEYDDTPGNERIHIFHRSGAFIEMDASGRMTIKSIHDTTRVSHLNDYAHVEGSRAETIDGSYRLFVNRDAGSEGMVVQIGAGGSYSVTLDGGSLNLNVNGDVNGTVTGDVNLNVSGHVDAQVGGDVSIEVGGSLTGVVSGGIELTGATITLTSAGTMTFNAPAYTFT